MPQIWNISGTCWVTGEQFSQDNVYQWKPIPDGWFALYRNDERVGIEANFPMAVAEMKRHGLIG